MSAFINSVFTTFENINLNQAADEYKSFAKNYPLINKIVIVANHILRLIPMIALLQALPFSAVANCSLMLAGSVFYRVTVERLCPLRFALLSCLGAIAYQIATLNTGLVRAIPLTLYGISVIYTSMTSNEKKRGGGCGCG